MPNNSVTTVILIRHAERAVSAGADPPLNVMGIARAKSLVRVMGSAEIEVIYTSKFIRTKETAAPLATHLGILPVQLDDPANIKDHILNNHVGKTVLVVGHTNTVPEIIELLGGTDNIMIAETEFDNLFVMTHNQNGSSAAVRFKYGNTN